MPGVILRPVIENNSPIPGLVKGFARLRKQAMRETAEFWHDKLLKPHFGPANRSRFAHESREPFYLQEIKRNTGSGQGKFVDDVLTGRSMRFMLAFSTVTGTANAATLSMKPPGYFKNPFEGTYRDKDGKTKRISGQPDKAAEVTTIDARDARAISEFHAQRLVALINAAKQQTTKALT